MKTFSNFQGQNESPRDYVTELQLFGATFSGFVVFNVIFWFILWKFLTLIQVKRNAKCAHIMKFTYNDCKYDELAPEVYEHCISIAT